MSLLFLTIIFFSYRHNSRIEMFGFLTFCCKFTYVVFNRIKLTLSYWTKNLCFNPEQGKSESPTQNFCWVLFSRSENSATGWHEMITCISLHNFLFVCFLHSVQLRSVKSIKTKNALKKILYLLLTKTQMWNRQFQNNLALCGKGLYVINDSWWIVDWFWVDVF